MLDNAHMSTSESRASEEHLIENLTMREIGDRIRTLRESAKQTQQEFAGLIGCSRRQVAKIEDGLAVPSVWNLRNLRNTHNVDPEWIISGPQTEPMAHSISQDWVRYDRLAEEVRKMSLSRGLELPETMIHDYARIVFEKAPVVESEAMAIIERVILSNVRSS
jgi:transcriptional regulator with XRE-family HTH domain